MNSYKRSSKPFKTSASKQPRYQKYIPQRQVSRYGAAIQARGELKVNDIQLTQGIDTTGTILLLNGTALGSDFTARIGRKIVMKSMYLRLNFFLQPSLTAMTGIKYAPTQFVRVIIFVDLQTNATGPTMADLLVNPTDVTTPLNLNNRERFNILKDKMLTFDAYYYNGTGDTGFLNRTAHAIKVFKKLNQEVIYNSSSTGTIGDITTGSLHLALLGTHATANELTNCIGTTRIRFIDP